MRLVSYTHGGRASFGVIVDGDVQDLATPEVPTLRDALEQSGIDGLKASAGSQGARVPLAAVRYLPPITNPDKILCVGLNYRLHADEAGMMAPQFPSIFARFPGSLVGHNEPVWRPRVSEHFDYEAELAVVIGRRARHVSVDGAMACIAGYTCFADNSVRDFQKHATQVTAGKNFQASGAFGPWLVTPDEAGDPARMEVVGRLNGREMQRDCAANMIFSVAELIAYISGFTELLPGDVIATGTPAGVGFTRKPPLYMKPGDVFEVEISAIGVLRNPVIDEPGAKSHETKIV